MARTGRRPGVSGTREAILDAARRAFAEHGYQHATIRGVADLAGVDPALVHHYFGTKQALFVAAVQLPVNPVEQLMAVLAEDPGQAGERMVELFLSIWDHAADQSPLLALVRSAVGDEHAAAMLREFITEEVPRPDRPPARQPRRAAAGDAGRLPDHRPGHGPLHRQGRAARLGPGGPGGARPSARLCSAT